MPSHQEPGLSAAGIFAFRGERLVLRDVSLTVAAGGALRDVPGRMLSAGQRRRVALARVVGRGAGLWLLDEPTLGLDAESVGALGGLMAGHRAVGGVVVAATHLPLPLVGAGELRLGVVGGGVDRHG